MSHYELEEHDYAERIDVSLWRRVLAHARPYRRSLWGMAISGLVMAIADSVLPLVTVTVVCPAVTDTAGSLFQAISFLVI